LGRYFLLNFINFGGNSGGQLACLADSLINTRS
jgi:hypothetical protein